MVCQNCGKPINKISICPTCHSDNTIFVKAKNASIRQYNKGVTAAKEGDYSTAINCLNQCILFDKRNYMARNLLGIAYYEVGMVADALRQWIISKSLKAEKNPATKYIDAIQGSQRLLEKQEDSITMFNSALTKFRLNNKDLGVIQLKNALTLNPKLVEANNLLAAYYISENDIQKAKLHISKTLNIDKRNPKALEYLSLITHDHIVNNKNATYNTGYNEKPNFTYRLNFFPKKELFTFVAGAIIASVIATVLIFPEIKNNLFVQVQNLQSEVERLEEEGENGTSRFALAYEQLNIENQQLKEEMAKYQQDEKVKINQNNLQLATIYTATDKMGEAASLLFNLDLSVFNADELKTIENLKSICYPVTAQHYFEAGQKAFNSGDYETALSHLQSAYNFGNKEDFMDDTLYLLGRLSEQSGDYTQAKEYYSRILNEFSDSNIFSQAEELLKNLISQGF